MFDGISKDLNTAELIKQILGLDPDQSLNLVVQHLHHLLLACLQGLTATNLQPSLYMDIFSSHISVQTHEWAKEKWRQAHPTLVPASHLFPPTKLPPIAPPSLEEYIESIQELMKTMLTHQFPGSSKNNPQDLTCKERKDDRYGTTIHMSQHKHEQLCVMYGLNNFANTTNFTQWMQETIARVLSNSF